MIKVKVEARREVSSEAADPFILGRSGDIPPAILYPSMTAAYSSSIRELRFPEQWIHFFVYELGGELSLHLPIPSSKILRFVEQGIQFLVQWVVTRDASSSLRFFG